MHHAHERGVLHRDLKPANLLFDEMGQVYVSDFGLARFADDSGSELTLPAAVLGTPHYLAPEVAARGARAATTATDVWSLAVILYEMLAQRRPFEADSAAAVLRAIAEREPPRPSRYQRNVPRDLEVIVGKAMASNPAARYGTARALAEDLRRWLDARPIHARPVSTLERIGLWARRNPTVAALSCALVVALLAGGVSLAVAWRSSRESARELRHSLYAADISVAHRAASDGDIGRAAALLDAWIPQPGAVDLRGFAWHYLRAQVRSDPCQVLRGHTALVSGLVILPAGDRFFTCAQDGEVRGWRLPSGEPAGVWRVGDGSLLDIDALPDSRLVVTGEQGLQLLNPATGALAGMRGNVSYSVRAAPDGSAALAGAHVFLFQTDDEIDIVPIPGSDAPALHPSEVRVLPKSGGRAAFSPNGRLLATGPWHDSIKLWSWPDAALLGELRPSGTVLALAFSPDGATLAAAERTGYIVLWDVAEKRIKTRLAEHTPRVAWSVAFSHDGARLVTTGSDQMVRLWDAHSFALLHTYRGHSSEVWRAEFTPDDRHIVSTSKDETVRIWNADPGGSPALPAGIRPQTAPVISDDSRLLAAPLEEGVLAVFEVHTWREVVRCGGGELPLALVNDGTRLIGIDPGRALRTWRVPDGGLEKETRLEKVNPQTVRHMLSHDARWLAGYAGDNDIVIWDAATGKVTSRLKGHANPVLCADFSPTGQWLATGSSDFTTRLWRVSGDGRFAAGPILGGHKLAVTDVAFSPDGSSVATASWDETVRIWSIPDGRQKHVFPGHFAGALSVVFLPGSPTVATLSGETTLKFWDLRSGRILFDLPGSSGSPTNDLVASPDGRLLLAAGEDGRLRVWEASK